MSAQIVQVAAGQANVTVNKQLLTANDRTVMTRRDFNKIAAGAFPTILVDQGPGILCTAPVNLTGITTDATVYGTITPGFAGRIEAAFALVTVAATTASRTATLGVFIDQDAGGGLVSTAASGGVIALTSANATPAGKIVPATRIIWSAANPQDFAAAATINFVTTLAPTAFAEGQVVFGVVVVPSAPVKTPGPFES